uniref:Uncharacterized protein n=1 Tax=Eptatretus burgeri TaxID=7764 RepID=A0A8C4WNR9_EPTBU
MVLRGKKSVLPSRPAAPSVQDMIDDVNAAAPDDPVFCPAEEIAGLSMQHIGHNTFLRYRASCRFGLISQW